MEAVIAKLNSDDIPQVVDGLKTLRQSTELHIPYLKASPLANELIQIWQLSSKQEAAMEAGVEALILAALNQLLLNCDTVSASRLGQSLLKTEQFALARLRNLVEKRHKNNQDQSLLAFSLVTSLASVDYTLCKEVQHRFDFKTLVASTPSPKQVLAMSTLFCTILHQSEQQNPAQQRRFLFESSLGAFVLDHIQDLPCNMLKENLLPRCQLSPVITPALLKCMQFHPDPSARQEVLQCVLQLVRTASPGSKPISMVVDLLEPFGDFYHAEVFDLCLQGSTRRHASGVVLRKMKLCKFEPRNSFHWFKMVSLLCRFLKDGVDIPEEMLSRAMLVRGLLFNGNALVRLFTLDLIAHWLVSMNAGSVVSKETLVRRLPEVSLLVSFHATYVKTNKSQDQVLYLRALRVLELYAKLGLLVKFDPMRFLPTGDEENGAVVWYHVVRFLYAYNGGDLAELWLKTIDNNTGTVLGRVLQVYCRNASPLAKETKEMLEHLLCLAFQGIVKSTLLDCVEINSQECLVSQTSKRILRFCQKSAGNLELVQHNVLRMKRECHGVVFDVDKFAPPYSNVEALQQKELSAKEVDALLGRTKPCDLAEEIAAPLGELLASAGAKHLLVLASRIVENFAVHPQRFSALNAVHALLKPRPALPLESVLELNSVLNALPADSPFPIAQSVVQDIAYYFASTEFNHDKKHTLQTRAKAMCNPLSTHKQRLDFAQELVQKREFSAFAALFDYDPKLILDSKVFGEVFTHGEYSILLTAAQRFPAQVCFGANRFPQAMDKFLSTDLQSDNNELRKLLLRLPGLCTFIACKQQQQAVACETASFCLTEHQQQEQAATVPCTVESLETCSVLPRMEEFSTLLLEEFDKVNNALVKLKAFDSKKVISKSASKQFVNVTFEGAQQGNTRVQAVCHLVEMKRAKPHNVLRLLLQWPQCNFALLPQAELAYVAVLQGGIDELEETERKALLRQTLLAYHGTLGKRDLYLRQILHLMEALDHTTLVANGYSFGNQLVNGAQPVMTLKDVSAAIRACSWVFDVLDGKRLRAKPDLVRPLAPELPPTTSSSHEGYDPSYLLRAFNFILALHGLETNLPPTAPMEEEKPAAEIQEDEEEAVLTSFQPKRWILGGHVDFIFQHMASTQLEVRREAYSCLQRFAQLLARTNQTLVHFRDDVLVLLRALKTGITTEYEQLPPLIAAYACEFLQVLCRGTAHNALHYRLVTSFLFSNTDSGWRFNDIPLFYETINSGSVQDCQQERAFTLNILAKGVSTKQDLAILHKRHTLEILLSVFDSNMSDLQTKRLVLKLFHQVALIKNGGGALEVLRNGFLPFALGVFSKLESDNADSMEMATKCSEILKLLAQARCPLFARVLERDAKRLKQDQHVGENWFPRCEWSCDESEMQFAAREIVQVACRFASQHEELFANLLDFLLAQQGLLRLGCGELLQLVSACTGAERFYSKLVELILGSMSLHVTTREDLMKGGGGGVLFAYVIKHSAGKERQVFAWLAQVARLAAGLLPIEALLDTYSNCKLEYIAELNQVCMIALSAQRTLHGAFAQHARMEIVPKLLEMQNNDSRIRDLFPVLIYEALTDSADGAGFISVANRLGLEF